MNSWESIISNVQIYGFDESVKASKYPMSIDIDSLNSEMTNTVIKLGNSKKASGHDNFLNGVVVQFDLKFSNKAWVELQRYHFIDFVSSQSSLHKITKFDIKKQCNEYVDKEIIRILEDKVEEYNNWHNFIPYEDWFESNVAKKYNIKNIKDYNAFVRELYLKVLYNIPSGFQLTARMTTNYRQLKTIYSQRRLHKLPDWQMFCDWIETLPYFKEICLGQ